MEDASAKHVGIACAMKTDLLRRVSAVLDKFNWFKMHEIMYLVGWKWALPHGSFRVPYEREIKEAAKEILLCAVEEWLKNPWIESRLSSGGLVVAVDRFGDISVSFEVMTCESETEDGVTTVTSWGMGSKDE